MKQPTLPFAGSAIQQKINFNALPVKVVTEIGTKVLERGEEMQNYSVTDFAVARIEAIFDGKAKTVWLFNHDSQKGDRTSFGPITGGHVSTSKHRALGAFLLQNRIGKGTYNNSPVEVLNITIYRPELPSGKFDAVLGQVELAETDPILFSSLRYFLKELKKSSIPEADNEELDKKNLDDKAQTLLINVKAREESILNELRESQRYIRDTNALRLAPILDKHQSRVKDLRVGNGALIIDGGPGTGKTTTLIQRIHFLIQKDILLERKLIRNSRVADALDSNHGWIFFSPSELLKDYLAQAMAMEGLKAGNTKMKVWSSYIGELFREYGLFQIGSQKKPPFRKAHGLDFSVLPNDWGVIEFLMNALDKVWTEDTKKMLIRTVPELDDKALNLLRQKLNNSVKSSDANDWHALYRFFNSFRDEYSSQLQSLYKELKLIVEKAAGEATIRLQEKNDLLFTEVAEWALQTSADDLENDEEDDDDESEIDEDVIVSQDYESAVLRKMRGWVRNSGMLSLKKGHTLKPKQKEWFQRIEMYIQTPNLKRIGELAYLLKGYHKLTTGADRLMLSIIPRTYKEFRKRIISGNIPLKDLSNIFGAIDTTGKDRLHYDEMNFLFAWLNRKVSSIATRFPNHFEQSNQRYIKGYRDAFRYNVVVDEASDFSLIELLAMESLTDNSYKSITLCGDLMQRMTSAGVKDWNEFIKGIDKGGEIHELKISYRQTPTLLKAAKKFYEQVTGKVANYGSAAKPSSYEPKPWIENLVTTESVTKWLGDKILYIHNQYEGKTPSIAVFCPNDEVVQQTTKLLSKHEELLDFDIKVQGVDSSTSMVNQTAVCVYNIKNIKGLEFEAAFFIDIDCIENTNNELLQKYLYVGLSRAAFYLGITYRNSIPSDIASAFEL